MRVSTRKSAIAVLGLMLAATVATAEEESRQAADATVKFSGGTVALGMGYAWGSGVLTYKGKEYNFRIDGLSAGSVGVAGIDATGEVFHLNKLGDFAGKYAGLTAAATVGGGVRFSLIQNGSGVYIQLYGTGIGMLFEAGPSGFSVVMESQSSAKP